MTYETRDGQALPEGRFQDLVHRQLDGEATPDEQARVRRESERDRARAELADELAAVDRLARATAPAVEASPGFDGRVLAAVGLVPAASGPAASDPSSLPPARPARLPTLVSHAATAAVALLAGLLWNLDRHRAPAPAAPPRTAAATAAARPALIAAPGPRVLPEGAVFVYRSAEAKQVSVAGDFTAWEEVPLDRVEASDGSVVFTGYFHMEPGRYAYQVIVDGAWMADPSAQLVSDGFSAENSIIDVGDGRYR